MHSKTVALLIETSNAYARGLLEGIAEFVRHRGHWSIFLPEQERGGTPPSWLKHWQGDGVIARIETEQIATAVKRLKIPVVDVSAARLVPDFPCIESHDKVVAQTGVKHLADRGFRNLAFCGDPGFMWSNFRRRYFEETAIARGCKVHVHDSLSRSDPKYSWNREKRRLEKWLTSLPKPVGILACYDIQAQKLLHVCRDLNIAVPEEVAVLGVDNDPLLCELSDPPLSSVILDTRQTGYQAASLLDAMMSGRNIESRVTLVEPKGVSTRQSTDILAIDDPDIAAAVRFIRRNATQGINVADVLREVPLSRRALESRFQKTLGRTPHEEITRLRVEKIKQLLTETELPLSEIARQTGFDHDEYMSVFFRKATGTPPGKFRRATSRSR